MVNHLIYFSVQNVGSNIHPIYAIQWLRSIDELNLTRVTLYITQSSRDEPQLVCGVGNCTTSGHLSRRYSCHIVDVTHLFKYVFVPSVISPLLNGSTLYYHIYYCYSRIGIFPLIFYQTYYAGFSG